MQLYLCRSLLAFAATIFVIFLQSSGRARGSAESSEGFRNWVHQVGHQKQSRARLGPPELVTLEESRASFAVEMEGNVTFVVDQRGYGDFVTVQAAIDAVVPSIGARRVVIHIRAGIYREKVMVPKAEASITLQGEGSLDTVLDWNDTASDVDLQGNLFKRAYRSATVAVEGHGFVARNLTFKNSAAAAAQSAGAVGRQAAAIRVSGDMAAFHGCRFLGAQDTLYDHKGRHYFQDCYIEGSIDFIFGNGLSQYRACELHAISQQGSFIAQKRLNLTGNLKASDNSGFVFVNCKVTGMGQLYLGLTWGLFARVVFAFSYIEDTVVDPRDVEEHSALDIFFGQYNCFGPGSVQATRVSWAQELSFDEAQPFLSLDFIDGEQWMNREAAVSHLKP